MAHLSRFAEGCLTRLVPSTLLGRLAMLLFVAEVSSHVLALTMMFGLMRPPRMNDIHGPHGPPPGMGIDILLDIAIRLAALTLAA